MKNFLYIEALKNHVGQKVTLKGWVTRTRPSGKVKFLVLRDGTGLCQCIFVKDECDNEGFENFKELTQECAVEVGRTPLLAPLTTRDFKLQAG